MTIWTAEFEKKAEKAIANMHPTMRRRVLDAIDALLVDPFKSPNVKALQGRDGYRLRVGEWRVLYRLERERIVVVVIDIGPRGGIY